MKIKTYQDIKITLLNFEKNIANKAFEFGRLGEFYNYNTKKTKIIREIIAGKTFPKYVFEGTNISFRIENISRICLAQLTRERGFFCSASGDVRPLTQELLIPRNIRNNKKWMTKIKKAQSILENVYIDMLEHNIPYMDARYIGLHCQTISLTYCTSVFNFLKSCNVRTENNFADEINYIYRVMLWELKKAIKKYCNGLNLKVWTWLLKFADKKTEYTRDNTYNNDFERFKTTKKYKQAAHNNFVNSGWFQELIYILHNQPQLLFNGECEMIKKWLSYKNKKDIPTSFDENGPWAGKTLIKKMYYYKKGK